MIFGPTKVNVKSYTPKCSITDDSVRQFWPASGERFVGHPWAFHSENSEPFIAVEVHRKTIRTINALNLDEIEFEGMQ